MAKQNRPTTKEDVILDQFLRPKTWDDFIGQEKIKKALKVLIAASKKRRSVCDHILFYGPAGLGKTTLAYLIAKELSTKLTVTSGPAIKKTGDLAATLSNLEEGEVLFIDETHRLNKEVEEILYPAMEYHTLHIMVGKGVSARSLELKLAPFTLIAATTKPSLLSAPLRSRFGSINHLDFYSESEITKIIQRSAKLLDITIDNNALTVLSKASRATPRIANRLLKRTLDLATVKNTPHITEGIARDTLELLGIDEFGLEQLDIALLELIAKKFHGGPVGIQTLAVALNEEPRTIEDLCEPYLIRLGFMERTPKGRIITTYAYQYLKEKKHLV